MEEQDKLLQEVTQREYQYGFFSDIETDIIDIGLSEDVVRIISEKKNEPEFMLEFRLNAYRKWLKMEMPDWAFLKIPPIDFQSISYYAAPTKKPKYESLDEVDPELLETFNKLGFPSKNRNTLPVWLLMR
jgi:Fe-S cluster assembly protein SufB